MTERRPAPDDEGADGVPVAARGSVSHGGPATRGSASRFGGSRLSDLTDEELVERAQSGNSRAFETLLRRHQRSMFGTY